MPHHPMTGPEFSLPILEGTGQTGVRSNGSAAAGAAGDQNSLHHANSDSNSDSNPNLNSNSTSNSTLTPSTDLLELAAKFSAQSGGGLSPQTSAALALEIVLNEIVEQACLATGAYGAAIVALRDGEMVCRARAGTMAPDLGAHLNLASGISGECIIHQHVQRCNDTEIDPLADLEASRRLGVRSLIVYPLLQHGGLIGILEIFSSRPGAFGQRDENTLGALASRVVKSFERAAAPVVVAVPAPVPARVPSLATAAAVAPAVILATPVIPATPVARSVPVVVPSAPVAAATVVASKIAPVVEERRLNIHEIQSDKVRDLRLLLAANQPPARRFDAVTWMSTLAVMAGIGVLGFLVGQRLGWEKVLLRRTIALETAVRPTGAVNADAATKVDAKSSNSSGNNKDAGNPLRAAVATKTAASPPPEGSLLVYENGKEVFRMPPTAADPDAHEQGVAEQGSGMQNASSIEPDSVLQVSQEAAEDSLLYRVEPQYPEEARQQQIEGAVILDARIGTDGAVQEVKLVSGPPLLAKAAAEAVKQWRFRPKMRNGLPAEMQTRITLNFRLSG